MEPTLDRPGHGGGADAGAAGWPWRPGCSVGLFPGACLPGQPPADQVAQVQCGGPVAEPGVVLGFSPVAELEAAAAEGRDLGDGPLDVRPVRHVVLAQCGPVAAGGARAAGG